MIMLCITLVLPIRSAKAQSTITTSGGIASGVGGTVSFTVGQLLVTVPTGVNGSVSHGVQQPYEISVITGLDKAEIDLAMKVFPNPASDFLILSIDKNEVTDFSYKLLDMNGRLLFTQKIRDRETTIPVGSLSPSIYILNIMEANRIIKTYKILVSR